MNAFLQLQEVIFIKRSDHLFVENNFERNYNKKKFNISPIN